jgi:hypothetical protein
LATSPVSPDGDEQQETTNDIDQSAVGRNKTQAIPQRTRRTAASARHKGWVLTDVVGVELVDPPEGSQAGRLDGPCGGRSDHGELSLVKVVGERGVESNVRVHDEDRSEDSVEDRVGRVGEVEGGDAVAAQQARGDGGEKKGDQFGRTRTGLGRGDDS